MTQHLESTPANATIALPDIEDLFTPFLVDIQKLADNNPIKIALDWSDSGKVIGDTVLEPGYGKPWPAEPEKSKVVPKEETTSESKERYAYDPQSQSYYTSERGEYYYDESGDLVSDTILEHGAGLKKYTTIPEGEAITPYTSYIEGPKHRDWQKITDLLAKSDLTSADLEEARRLQNEYYTNHGESYWKHSEPVMYAHSGGETLKEGLIEVERGEWILPGDVVAQFKELLTLPFLAPMAQTVTNTISVHIDTINDKSDADYLISKLERKFNQRALV